MKKIFALVLCMMLALSASAFAETASAGVHVTISEIELNLGEAMVVNPALSLSLGAEADYAWIELSAVLNGESVISAQVEVRNDEMYVSVEGANDVLQFTGVDAVLDAQGAGVTTAQVIESLNSGASQLNAETTATLIESLPDTLTGLTVEKLGESDYKLTYEESGLSASLRLTFAFGAEKSFDFSAKNPVVVADMDNMPESDVFTVAEGQIETLMAEESVVNLVTLFGSILNSVEAA